MRKYLILLLLCNPSYLLSSPGKSTLPGDKVISGATSTPYIPGDQVIPHLDLGDVSINDYIEKTKTLIDKAIKEGEPKNARVRTVSAERNVTRQSRPILVSKAKTKKEAPVEQETQAYEAPSYYSGMRIIHQNLKYVGMNNYREMVNLPKTSVALGTTLSGVEVAHKPEKILIQLDYAFIGPNGSIVEMTGCRMWASVTGDEATVRIKGKIDEVTCMTPSGKSFTRSMEAQILDGKDEYNGVKGETVFYGKDMAIFLDFINGGLTAFGDAMSRFQVKTEVSGNENPVQTENITGDETKYIAGKTLSGSMGKMMNWWVDYYMGLSPKVAVPTGSKVFIGLLSDVDIPKEFFGSRIPTDYLKDLARHVNTSGKVSGGK